jgi:hypothetical protein
MAAVLAPLEARASPATPMVSNILRAQLPVLTRDGAFASGL